MKHIVCYSGGNASAITAYNVKKNYPSDEVIFLNHNINPRFEKKDIKRFKKEVAEHLKESITFANVDGIIDENQIPSQFDVCVNTKSFVNIHTRQILCTSRLKTEPFYKYINNLQDKNEVIVYYGFDETEFDRIKRRKEILNEIGIKTDFPMVFWDKEKTQNYNLYLLECLWKDFKKIKNQKNLSFNEFLEKEKKFIQGCLDQRIVEFEKPKDKIIHIYSTLEIGINPPDVYEKFKHANCTGCLKAGKQHWYVVYCEDYEVFQMGKNAEEIIGHSFMKEFLKDLEPMFEQMKKRGIPANENIPSNIFWKSAKKYINKSQEDLFPCECFNF